MSTRTAASDSICRLAPAQWRQVSRIINDAATAYRGVIPADRYHEPYMPDDEVQRELERIEFYGWRSCGGITGVIGVEPVRDVTLIRHAYVRTANRRTGIGSALLTHAESLASTPVIMLGTWAAAAWAIRFYEKHGYELIEDRAETSRLLSNYWDIPDRQIETSVVMRKVRR